MYDKIEMLISAVAKSGSTFDMKASRVGGVWTVTIVIGGEEELRGEGRTLSVALGNLDEWAGACVDAIGDGCPICSAPQAGIPACQIHGA